MKVLYLIPTLLVIAAVGAIGALAVVKYSHASSEEEERLARLERVLHEKNLNLQQIVAGEKKQN